MTPAQMQAHARESLLLVCDRKGWTDTDKWTYAAECLVAAGVDRQEAHRVARDVWRERFETWEAN